MTMRTYVIYKLDVAIPVDLKDGEQLLRALNSAGDAWEAATGAISAIMAIDAQDDIVEFPSPRIVRRRAKVATPGVSAPNAGPSLPETIAAIRKLPWAKP